MDSSDNRVLVTGVPGRVGGVGGAIVDILRRRDLPVRALVLREDQRTDALQASGVDVVVGDLTRARDVAGALSGCRRNGRRNRLPGTRRFGCRLGPDAPRRSTRGMWVRSLQQFW